MLSEKEKIELITRISLELNETKDIDHLLERLLTSVRKVFNADAGSIYLRDGDKLKFSYTQNDTLQKRLKSGRKLIYSTYSIPINNDSIAGFVAKNLKAVNIPDVYEMGSRVPYRFDSHFDKLSKYRTRSTLTVPLTNQRKDLLGVMQLINAKDDAGNIIAFPSADEPLIMHFASSAALAVDRAQITRNIILRMISMAELRDPTETGPHVNRVAAYSVEIFEEWAQRKGMSPEEVEREKDLLRMAAMLHDVGKVAISDMILRKADRLSPEEFQIIQTHTYLGARLFKDMKSDFDEVAAMVALNHHEKWDGTGYPGHIDPFSGKPLPGHSGPDGKPLPKKGEEIPLFGRIVAVADVYDALCSRRSYKVPWDEDRTLEEMHQLSGKHFDPELIEAFFSCHDVLKAIAERYPDHLVSPNCFAIGGT
ncbi:MAG: HD domain-containing protein [Deltaproteobacteria bacterium]|nr:HD domain-containing protein [Deltaproteobacteria bacterium]